MTSRNSMGGTAEEAVDPITNVAKMIAKKETVERKIVISLIVIRASNLNLS